MCSDGLEFSFGTDVAYRLFSRNKRREIARERILI